MKNLTPIASWPTVFSMPEDFVDLRTAASMEPLFQALLNRSEYLAAVLAAIGEASVTATDFGPWVATGGEETVDLPFSVADDDVLVLWRGGVMLSRGREFTVSGATVTFTSACLADEAVTGFCIKAGGAGGGSGDLTETPSGVINSTDGYDGNANFLLNHAVAATTTPRVVVSGFIVLEPNDDFTWSGNTITFTAGNHPTDGETLSVTYSPA